MSMVALGLLILFGVMTAAFYVAGDLHGHYSPWAQDVCGLSSTLCDHPSWAAVATAAMGAIYLSLKALRL